MTKPFRPMLAASKLPDPASIKYPVLCSAKFDGIRCVIIEGIAYSRSLKPIRNRYIQSVIGKPEFNGLDGELIVGSATDTVVFRTTDSGVMRADGEPDFMYNVFDCFSNPGLQFSERLRIAQNKINGERMRRVEHLRINNVRELLEYEGRMVSTGYEGIIIRDMTAPYKNGRSTLREGWMLKLKRFEDDEAEIVGIEEMQHNNNRAQTNALGYTERSSHKENKVGAGTLGKLVCKDKNGIEFKIGTGFDDAERIRLYEMGTDLIGKFVKYKWAVSGGYDKPRSGVYLGLRSAEDM